MKLSTVLLSSAAFLVAGAAYAADLPAKKAAPAAAPTGCATFGAGYIAIPGGDTCLKISGYVRSNNNYMSGTNNVRPSNAAYSMSGSYGLQFDAKQSSDMGTVGSTIFIEDNATTNAFVTVGALSAGQMSHMLDIGLGYNHTGDAYGATHLAQLRYDIPMGSSTLSIAATTAAGSGGSGSTASGVASRPDFDAKIKTTAGAATVELGAVSHEAVGATGTAQGYAFIGKVGFDAGVAKLQAYAAYANAASNYIGAGYTAAGPGIPYTQAHGIWDTDTAAANQSSGSQLQAQIDVPVGKNDSIGLFGETISASQGANKYAKTQYSVALSHTIAKGLTLTPELYSEVVDSVTATGAYIRIERDF